MIVLLIGKIIYLLVKLNGHEFEQAPRNGEGLGSLCVTIHQVAESQIH